MKKVFLLATLAVGCMFTATAQVPAEDGALVAEIKFAETTHDFGVIEYKSNGAYDFQFTNVGNAPLVINGANTSCGCTTPSYTKTPVAPGETGTISVKYDTTRTGVFNKSVTIVSNAKTPQVVLYIKGEVKQPAPGQL
jgi:hypothetical protein